MGSPEAGPLTDHLERERRGLLAHCYRMLGSWDEAEDAVQETSLRAWRGFPTFQHRSSVRVWLYRIATNACLTALDGRSRRALPSGLGAPSDDPAAPPDLAGPENWIQPVPTAAVFDDPAAVVAERESVRLAFIAGLQYLPAKQRAVLLLREVLGFSAAEVAEMLDTTVPAVKSTLQRARGRLDEVAPARDEVHEPSAGRARELLEQYMAAWQAADVRAFEAVLRADAAIEPVGSRTWFAGRTTCLAFAAPSMGGPGDWRMAPADANGQPAAVAWFRDEPFGIAVLTPAEDGIARVTLFGDPSLVERFQLKGPLEQV
jgi:RNA polymerase sigma-70 factor (ECF subfamily)